MIAFVAVVLAIAAGPASGGSNANSGALPILFAGGIRATSAAGIRRTITLSSAEVFEPNHGASGSFVATGAMSTARVGHTATDLTNGRGSHCRRGQ